MPCGLPGRRDLSALGRAQRVEPEDDKEEEEEEEEEEREIHGRFMAFEALARVLVCGLSVQDRGIHPGPDCL